MGAEVGDEGDGGGGLEEVAAGGGPAGGGIDGVEPAGIAGLDGGADAFFVFGVGGGFAPGTGGAVEGEGNRGRAAAGHGEGEGGGGDGGVFGERAEVEVEEGAALGGHERVAGEEVVADAVGLGAGDVFVEGVVGVGEEGEGVGVRGGRMEEEEEEDWEEDGAHTRD